MAVTRPGAERSEERAEKEWESRSAVALVLHYTE